MNIIIFTGGTGGHFYPALKVGKKLSELGSKVIYIGTKDKLDYQVLSKMNLKFYSIAASGFSGGLSKKFTSIINLFKSIREIKKIIIEEEIEVLISFGGYIGFAGLIAGKIKRKLLLLHEQNSKPGLSNQVASNLVKKAITSFENTKLKKSINLGNPRSSIDAESLNSNISYLNLQKKKVILVAGSLGSTTLNKVFHQLILNYDHSYQIIFITGNNDYPSYQNLNIEDVIVLPYESQMISLISKSDLVVSRAGATIISEIKSLGVPSILIPSPNVTKNHQYYNALEMVQNNYSQLIEEKNLCYQTLIEKIEIGLDPIYSYQVKKSCLKLNSHKSLDSIIDLIEKEYQIWKKKK